jgi:hypothetical protein
MVMKLSRFRLLLGIGLIALGVIFLAQAIARPMIEPLQMLPALPLPAMPSLPPLPALPALPPLPAPPPLPQPPAAHEIPFLNHGGWFSPPLLLIGLIALAVIWRRASARMVAR